MDRIRKFLKKDFSAVFTEAKIPFDPKDKLVDMSALAVNNLEKFYPALDKLYPKPKPVKEPVPDPDPPALVPTDAEGRIALMLQNAREEADKIISDAKASAKSGDLAPAKKVRKKLTIAERNRIVTVVGKKNWECEMAGDKIVVFEEEPVDVKYWQMLRLAGQNVV